jgi:hypothetical protein
MMNLILQLVKAAWRMITKRKMEGTNCAESCKKNDLIVNVKARNIGRFKAGAELSGAVNIMDVNVDQEIGENFEAIEIKIRLNTETCVPTVVVS